jgi:outer membrane lipoprotein-sorting protein
MKRVSAGVVLVLLTAGISQAGGDSGRDPALALLSEALSAPSTVSYSGVVEVVRIGRGASEASVYRIEHRAPDLTRRTYSAPPSASGDAVVTEGNLSFAIERTRHRIVETRNDAPEGRLARRDNEALIRENYRAVEQGGETFDGRQTVDVLLINRYTHHRTLFVRIDRERKLVLDKQEFGEDGALVSETRFEQVRYGAVSSADFALPKQYGLVQAQTLQETSRDPARLARDAGFAARRPRLLPEGFAPLEGTLVEIRGVRTLDLLYSDGIRTVSLFECAAAVGPNMAPLHPEAIDVRGRSAEYAVDGTVALLSWSDGTLRYVLVGQLGRNDLTRFAATVTP